MASTTFNVTEAAVAAQPNMGGAQFASHTWMEPIVSDLDSTKFDSATDSCWAPILTPSLDPNITKFRSLWA